MVACCRQDQLVGLLLRHLSANRARCGRFHEHLHDHASRHGRTLPPAIIGAGRLAHHQTAAGLYEYIRSRMPWQAPGILSDEAYWQLTAYLVEANGITLEGVTLDPQHAPRVRLDGQTDEALPDADRGRSTALLLAALVALLLLGTIITRRWLPIA